MEKFHRVLCLRCGDFWEVSEKHDVIAKALELPNLTRNGQAHLGIPDHAFDNWAQKLKANFNIEIIKETQG
jgi:DNA mismatch repair ATPase MutS